MRLKALLGILHNEVAAEMRQVIADILQTMD
jgi:hypothetical protein